jgi:hypothetical protein
VSEDPAESDDEDFICGIVDQNEPLVSQIGNNNVKSEGSDSDSVSITDSLSGEG